MLTILLVVCVCIFIGCFGSGKSTKAITPSQPSPANTSETKQINDLKTENASLKEQIAKLQQDNRTATARAAGLETQLEDTKEQLASKSQPPPKPVPITKPKTIPKKEPAPIEATESKLQPPPEPVPTTKSKTIAKKEPAPIEATESNLQPPPEPVPATKPKTIAKKEPVPTEATESKPQPPPEPVPTAKPKTIAKKEPAPAEATISKPAPKPKPAVSVKPQPYEKGVELFQEKKYAEAASAFQSILDGNPTGTIVGNSHYWLGECEFGQKKYQVAITQFEKVLTYAGSEKGDDAQIMIANSYAAMGDKVKAIEGYKKLIDTFPSSPFVRTAKVKMGQLQNHD